jgi:hypothetical protein
MGCGSVLIRRQAGSTYDVMIERPANGPARVIVKGSGLDEGTYVVAGMDAGGGGSCNVYGQGGSGGGAVVSGTVTKDSGTPYSVTTINVVG